MEGYRVRIPPVTKNLIIINVIVWLAMMISPDNIGEKINQYGALYYWQSSLFNPAQIITYMFVHSTQSFFHIFFNMLTLFMFGTAIESLVGSRRFLFFYVACGIGAALVQEIVYTIMISSAASSLPAEALAMIKTQGAEIISKGYNYMDPAMGKLNMLFNLPSVGASGAIYGILLAFGMFFPNRPLYLFFLPIPIKAKYMVCGWIVMELALGFAAPGDGVAHFCHLGGMVAGFLIILYWKHKKIGGDKYIY